MANNDNIHDGHRKRLNEKAEMFGMEFLPEHEQLEKILFCIIPRGNTNPIAHELLDKFGTISAVLMASPKELQEVKGVGARTAQFLSDLPDMLGIVERSLKKSRTKLSTTEDIGAFASSLFYGKLYETVYIIFLDYKDGLIRFEKMSEGTTNSSSLYIRRVLDSALKNKATSVILAHNHPSGDCRPSENDDKITKSLGKALEQINIKLKDHIIVGTDEFYSYNASLNSGFGVFGFEMNFYEKLKENSLKKENK